MEFRKTTFDLKCGTQTLIFGLSQIATSPEGGVYIGERTILTHLPLDWKTEQMFSFYPEGQEHLDSNQGIFFAKKGAASGDDKDFAKFAAAILDNVKPCVSKDKYDTDFPSIDSPLSPMVHSSSECIVLDREDHFFPKDIMTADTSTYSLSRSVTFTPCHYSW